jgi:hypothetical protein
MRLRALVFPLPACGDYLPLLAIQDGRLGEMVRQCLDEGVQVDALAMLLGDLYPNGSWNG